MKKKITAFLTALTCLLSGVSTLPVSAVSSDDYSTHFAVLASVEVEPMKRNYVIIQWSGKSRTSMHYLTYDQMLYVFDTPENFPSTGDIVGMNTLSFGAQALGPVSPCYFTIQKNGVILGSARDETIVEYTCLNERTIIDPEGNPKAYYTGFCDDGFMPDEGFPNPTTARKGDKLTMAVNEYGYPLICLDISPLGDVNADKSLDILDVILMNKCVIAGEPLPALSGASNGDLGQCDFNGNGILDADDSLGMMKRILRLEGKDE